MMAQMAATMIVSILVTLRVSYSMLPWRLRLIIIRILVGLTMTVIVVLIVIAVLIVSIV